VIEIEVVPPLWPSSYLENVSVSLCVSCASLDGEESEVIERVLASLR